MEEAFKMDSDSFERKYGFRKPHPEEENVVVTCRSGRRAKLAIDALRPLGYQRLKWDRSTEKYRNSFFFEF